MAASMGIQANFSSYLSFLDSSIVAGSKREGVVIFKSDPNVADIVRVRRNVIVQSSVITECGGRGSLQCVNSKVGFGVHRGLGTGWTEEQSAIGADPRANGGRVRVAAVAPQADFEARPGPKVTFIPLALIGSEVEFDRVLSEAQDRNEPIIIDWMASWCRKCLYLKPKLEKLAAAFHPSIRFYYVDVNNVPQAMVKRADVTQMPTIQLWRNGAQEGQVIGGQEANAVVELVKDMIAKGAPRT